MLGAGGGWAHSIRFNPRCRGEFEAFFHRGDTFTLGVCNGCQMLALLRDLIPGADAWPRFVRNRSEQFEGRLVMTRGSTPRRRYFSPGWRARSCPPWLRTERAARSSSAARWSTPTRDRLICLHYLASDGAPAERHPANPNGSDAGVAGATTPDGRVTIMMPHPERTFRAVQHSWHPPNWGEHGPWLRMFVNARRWLD